MKSRLRLLGHPVHPIVVHLPIGVLVAALLAGLAALAVGEPWWTAGTWAVAIGVAAALVAAVPGLVDYLTVLRGHDHAHRQATKHLLCEIGAVVAWGAGLLARGGTGPVDSPALVVALDAIGLVLLGVGGYLGGHLVYHHRVGVEEPDER